MKEYEPPNLLALDRNALTKEIEGTYPSLQTLPKSIVSQLVTKLIDEMIFFETIALHDQKKRQLPRELLSKIDVLWILGGPGTYFQPFKAGDKFGQHEWAKWMDKKRILYGLYLSRKIAEAKYDIHESAEETLGVRKLLQEFSPYFLYNGTDEENGDFQRALSEKLTFFPLEKVIISRQSSIDTYNQMVTAREILKSIPHDSQQERKIGVITHGLHFPRVLRMIEFSRCLGKDDILIPFPVATPSSGQVEFAQKEISGILFYHFVSEIQKLSQEPFPHQVYRV